MTQAFNNTEGFTTPSNPHVIVWSKTGCHFCQEIKTYLETNGYAYTNLEVAGHDELRDILEAKYGIRHVPVVEVGQGATYTALLEPDLEKLRHLLAGQPIQQSV
ncbi:glutaredoxin family protein [Paenibacillus hunanensis]|uniref:Glutaredoxin n=1 Tax=Paenibacillus hunanensis TaxID=539262 RepID=A0ABU1ISX4_9BACL|nr:glutaredoxin family protein [Paenibacillus hunanensis]MDR6242355.1 glutaredoxin [Paenibacillus hunanensis]GGJ07176.1 putative glutaredoxin YtnI [Paenibacillus hunanensis]